MNFNLSKSIEIRENTPDVLVGMLQVISTDRAFQNDGCETRSVYDIAGHLWKVEKTDWNPGRGNYFFRRTRNTFEPVYRFHNIM